MTSENLRAFDVSFRVQRSSKQVHCQVGSAVVLMAVGSGEYFELNRLGSRIWQEVASKVAVHDLVDRLLAEFDVDRPTCEAQVLAWVHKMHGLGLLDVAQPDQG